MPLKKKKRTTGKTEPQAVRNQGKKKKKKSDQPSVHATSNGVPSPATQSLNTAPITTSSETRNAQTQSLLFMLPLEIRVMLYGLALANKALEIGERRMLRRQSLAKRYNQYTLANFDNKHFALLKTCTEIKKEVENFVLPGLAFTFSSSGALACFLGHRTGSGYYLDNDLDGCTFELLQRVARAEVVIKKHRTWYEPVYALRRIERTLKRPLNLEFVDEDRDESSISCTLKEAATRWKERMQELRALQAAG